ncbi:MAG: DUF7266 family protein [Halobacteriota archaeon]
MTDRGVSAVVNYVLVLGIVTLLGTGLFVAATDYVQGQQSTAIRAEFLDVGNELAGELSDTERVARSADGDGRVVATADLPERVAGSPYRITIQPTAADRGELVLQSSDPAVTVTVPFSSRTSVAETTVEGGPVVIRAEVTAGNVTALEVADG